MTRMVVDTDVYSYITKKSPSAEPFNKSLRGCQVVLSFQTIAELFKWTVVKGWQQPQIDQLERSFRECVIVPYDRDLAWTWARITGECHKLGRPMSAGDAWVAAAAIRYQIPLMTNNLRHYETAQDHCGLVIARV